MSPGLMFRAQMTQVLPVLFPTHTRSGARGNTPSASRLRTERKSASARLLLSDMLERPHDHWVNQPLVPMRRRVSVRRRCVSVTSCQVRLAVDGVTMTHLPVDADAVYGLGRRTLVHIHTRYKRKERDASGARRAESRAYSSYVFCSPTGTLCTLQRDWKPALRVSKRPDFRFHVRHTTSVSRFGTRSRRPVQRAGRWKTQFMVQRYAHLRPDTSGLLSSGCLTRNQGALPHQNWH